MPTGKYRLHATKVDRIAVVDRPAVPDAQIVLFKRRQDDKVMDSEILTKDVSRFGQNLLFFVTEGAIHALEQDFFQTTFDDTLDEKGMMDNLKKLFRKFKESIFQLMDIPEVQKNKAQEEPTPSEVATSFKNGLLSIAISDAFELFKNHLTWFVTNGKQFSDSADIIDKLIDTFRDYVLDNAQQMREKGLTKEKAVVEKEGRAISAQRLARLKQALRVLKDIIEEAESRIKDKSLSKEDVMDKNKKEETKEKQMSPEELTAAVGGLQEAVGGVVEKVTALDGRLTAVEEALKVQKEETEKYVSANAELLKALDALKAQFVASIEENKKLKGEADARIEKVEKSVAGYDKTFQVVNKRLGIKTGLPIEGEEKNEDTPKKDVFGDALRGKKS